MSCHVISCHVMSCHVMSCHVLSCHVMSCHVISRPLTSSHVLSCHVMSCHVIMSCHLTSSHVLSRLVISCHLARESCSRIFLPSLLNSTIMAAGWPRRGFRNRGPVRESGSERRSRERARVAPCTFLRPGHRFAWQAAGIGRVASVRVWRRAHFCDLGIVLRGRLRGSGVLEVCRGRAAALCRGDWVPGVFCTRMVNVRFAWQAAGIVRAGSVLGACWRAVSAAPCRGDWVPGVSRARARMILRAATCGSRGRRGTSDALMRSGAGAMNRARLLKSRDFVAPCDKSRVRARVGRCEIVAGAGNPWICGCELGADVSWNAAAGCVGRVARSALCRTQWQAVTMGVGRVARVARAALCHGDCCWACRLGGAVPWGLLLGVSRGWRCAMAMGVSRGWRCAMAMGVSRGWRCAMGIAAGRVAWVALCHA